MLIFIKRNAICAAALGVILAAGVSIAREDGGGNWQALSVVAPAAITLPQLPAPPPVAPSTVPSVPTAPDGPALPPESPVPAVPSLPTPAPPPVPPILLP